VVFVGTGDPAELPKSSRRAIETAAALAAWVALPDLTDNRETVRLSGPPASEAWHTALEPHLGRPLVYLAPGVGADDDPGVPIVEALLRGAGYDLQRVGGRGLDVEGLALVGPAGTKWRPDAAKVAWARGLRDRTELDRWVELVQSEYGPSAVPEARPWHTTSWSPVSEIRTPDAFPLTLRIRPTARSEARATERLRDVIETLRGPDGCPWDREQTHESLRPFMLEEAYESVAAIESGDRGALADELGDVLLQVALHAEIARQSDAFAWPDVVEAITTKMIRRHPHVFANEVAQDAAAVMAIWHRLKRTEQNPNNDPLHGLPDALPALAYASELVSRADGAGLHIDLPGDPARTLAASLDGEVNAERIGDALVALAAQTQRNGLDLEMAVRDATRRLRRRIVDSRTTE
jgi:NTP pyrophosphatase (non-canonical NTP hydrolase)